MFRFIRNPDPTKKPPFGSRLDPTHPLSQGLVGCWLMNEGGGNIVFDLVRNYKLDFISSPVWGRNGVVLDDASSQYLHISDFPMIKDATTFSIVIYANLRNIDTRATTLFSTSSSSHGCSFKAEQYDDTGKVGFTFNGVADYTSAILTPVGTDSIFTATRIGASGNLDIYVDNEHDVLSVGTMSDSTYTDMVLGAWPANGTSGDYVDGTLYLAMVYFDRILSQSEILQLKAEPYAHILVPQYWSMVDFYNVAPAAFKAFWAKNSTATIGEVG